MKATVVCGKPDCDHMSPDICNALPLANYLLAGGDKIYYVKTTYSNGQNEKLIQSVKFDATDRKTVQKLKDVLFQCDLSDLSVKQVWVTPGKDEVANRRGPASRSASGMSYHDDVY